MLQGPIVLLPRILKKIREDQATCLVIAPNWPGQPWMAPYTSGNVNRHSLHSSTIRGDPVLPFNSEAIHPLWRSLKLAVWPVSGNAADWVAFPSRSQMSSWHHGEKGPKSVMKAHGNVGTASACRGINVPFQHL